MSPHFSKTHLESLLVIADISRALNEFRPLDETLHVICEEVASLRGYDYTSVMMLNSEQDALVIRGSAGISDEYVEHINNRRRVLLDERAGELAPAAHAFLHGTEVAIADIEAEPGYGAWKESAQLLGWRAIASVPVVVRSRLIGVLNCYHRAPHRHSDEEVQILELVSQLAGVAIETARLGAEQRRAADELRAQTEQLHQQNRQLGELFSAVSRLTREVGHADATVLSRVAETLNNIAGRAVLVCAADGRAVAFAGRSELETRMQLIAGRRDVTARLASESSVTVDDVTLLRVGVASAPLGCLVLWPSLVDHDRIAMVAATHAVSLVAAELEAARADRALTTYARPAVFTALSHGAYPPPQVRDAARVLGVLAEQAFRLAEIQCVNTDDARQIARGLEELQAYGWRAIVGAPVGRTALVLLDGEHDVPEAIRASGRELVERRSREVRGIGVSSVVKGLSEVPAAREQARAAIEAAHEHARVVLYDDLGIFGGIARSLTRSQSMALVNEVLGPLRAHDAARGTYLVATLEAYVRSCGKPRAAARALNLHVNTLHQRLRRCGELGGFDPHNLAGLSRLVLAFELDRISRAQCARMA